MKTNTERVRKCRELKRKKGICFDCSADAVVGKLRCKFHLKKCVESYKVLAEKRKKLGKCIRCGGNLPFMEQGVYVVCSVCGSPILKALRVLVNKGVVGYNRKNALSKV